MQFKWVNMKTTNGQFSGSRGILLGEIPVGYVWQTPKIHRGQKESFVAQLHLPKAAKQARYETREEAERMLEAALTSWLMNTGLWKEETNG